MSPWTAPLPQRTLVLFAGTSLATAALAAWQDDARPNENPLGVVFEITFGLAGVLLALGIAVLAAKGVTRALTWLGKRRKP